MSDSKNSGGVEPKRKASGGDQQIDRVISGKLRTFYDGIIEEGTPDHLMSLLEKLEAAERAASSQKK